MVKIGVLEGIIDVFWDNNDIVFDSSILGNYKKVNFESCNSIIAEVFDKVGSLVGYYGVFNTGWSHMSIVVSDIKEEVMRTVGYLSVSELQDLYEYEQANLTNYVLPEWGYPRRRLNSAVLSMQLDSVLMGCDVKFGMSVGTLIKMLELEGFKLLINYKSIKRGMGICTAIYYYKSVLISLEYACRGVDSSSLDTFTARAYVLGYLDDASTVSRQGNIFVSSSSSFYVVHEDTYGSLYFIHGEVDNGLMQLLRDNRGNFVRGYSLDCLSDCTLTDSLIVALLPRMSDNMLWRYGSNSSVHDYWHYILLKYFSKYWDTGFKECNKPLLAFLDNKLYETRELCSSVGKLDIKANFKEYIGSFDYGYSNRLF